jgi:hypothetical protein
MRPNAASSSSMLAGSAICKRIILAAMLVAFGAAPAVADLLVASSPGTVATFGDGAQGNVAPARAISGSSAQLALPAGVAVDPVRGEVYVVSYTYTQVNVYSTTDSGNVAPKRSLGGPNTGLYAPSGVAVDLVHQELVVSNFNHSPVNEAVGKITTYPLSANGDVAPIRTIVGPAALLTGLTELAIDPAAGEIYVTTKGAVLTFDRTANGNVAPKRSITGSNTRLGFLHGIAVDQVNRELIVANQGGSIEVYKQGDQGNVAPQRRISGGATGLQAGQLQDVALLNDAEIAVTSSGDNAVKIFPRTGDGDVAPLRTIAGAATGLFDPIGIAVYHPALLLGSGRFALQAAWRTPDGNAGGGTPISITGDTGYFWFFSPTNVEVVSKVLNGCGTNGKFWVFAGGLTNVAADLQVTDLGTGKVRRYTNSQGSKFAPVQDTSAFATCGAAKEDAGAIERPAEPASFTPAPLVAPACSGLCLNGGRFQVTATWKTTDGRSGSATGVALTSDTGYLWFFGASNVEVVLKVLNGCGLDNHYWVFAGGLTNVQVVLTVLDTVRGTSTVYHNPQGMAFQPIQDTGAFATCP